MLACCGDLAGMFPDYRMRRLSFSVPDFLPENMLLHSRQGASSSVYPQHLRVTFFFGWKHGFSILGRKETKSQPGWSWSFGGRGFLPWYSGHGLQTNALCASRHLLPANLPLQGIHSGLILLFFSLTKGKYGVGEESLYSEKNCSVHSCSHYSIDQFTEPGSGAETLHNTPWALKPQFL